MKNKKTKSGLILGGVIFLMAVFLFSGCSIDLDEFSRTDLTKSSTEEIKTFKGYQCTDDCSGHKAGYDWAREEGITDPDDCGGKSKSFVEGCMSYANEH